MTSAASMTIAEQEKNSAALTSVLAAVGLSVFKIVVGLMTNSLGILAEAAHSGLDLVAALVTWFAVRVSGKPADLEHHYGHGKIENLSALFETILLLVTCVWIIYESIQRLFFKAEEVEVSFWAFLVMAVSIIIDYSRSRVLSRAAQKYNSQALEADALHFRTDIWSSSVVIVGLVAVKLADILPDIPILAKADAIAALGVALIVVYVSIELGARTIHGLLDQAPKELAEQVKTAAEAIPGILECHQVRVRPAGPGLFIDLHIVAAPHLSLQEAHDLTLKVEETIEVLAPGADITVHVEPAEAPVGQDQASTSAQDDK